MLGSTRLMEQRRLPCPCGTGKAFGACCCPAFTGLPASTAEALMRSRYVAFVVGDHDYLQRTYAPEYKTDSAPSQTDVEWIGLEICAVAKGGPDDDDGTVEFKARFRQSGATGVHHEISRFRRDAGHWVYIDGSFPAAAKVGRNDPCPCGSGKKFKQCCGA